jgi:RimJ/RimL family protein N-acetyltransferase
MRIETERLVLREFREDDLATMLDYWRDPLYQRYNREFADMERFVGELVEGFIAAQAEEPRRKRQLVIQRKAEDRMIGNVGIRVNDSELGEANIGYELNPRDWGQGYATEAAGAILRFGFKKLRLHRVWAECVVDNAGSWRVMEKLGMRREAHFHEHQWFRGRWWDTYIYAVLANEWNDGGNRQQAAGNRN